MSNIKTVPLKDKPGGNTIGWVEWDQDDPFAHVKGIILDPEWRTKLQGGALDHLSIDWSDEAVPT